MVSVTSCSICELLQVGIPGKSSVAGSMMMVLPNTMGMMIVLASAIGSMMTLTQSMGRMIILPNTIGMMLVLPYTFGRITILSQYHGNDDGPPFCIGYDDDPS